MTRHFRPSAPAALPEILDTERVVCLTPAAWAAAEAMFTVVARHPTGLAGDLVIARGPRGLVAIEHPEAEQVYVRRLASEEDAGAFVRRRLAQYERFWDG